jgi:hypothetical protein
MMKVLLFHSTFAYWTAAFLLLSLPSRSLACDCIPGSLNGTLYNNPDSTVIAGRIIDELKLTTVGSSQGQKYYTFKVKQVYKTCSPLQRDDTIIVSTSASSASCGLDLEPDTRYVVSARETEIDSMNVPTVFQVNVGLCNYHAKLPIAPEVTLALRQYRNTENGVQCNDGSTSSSLPLPCNTGATCDQTNEYCDASSNQCVSIDAPCPTPPVDCVVAPCTVTDPCQEAEGPLICINNYCGGCNAIFLDAKRTQVCNSA